MTDNPLVDWYNEDSRVKEIIDKLDSSEKNFEKQAEEAFHKFCEVFTLPKFPEDITGKIYEQHEQEGLDEPRSVYEEIGILRYLEPNDDLRSIVFLALYNIKNFSYIDIDHCASKYFGSESKIPKEYMVYYTGENSKSLLNFLKNNESWTKEGVKYASKIIRN